MRAHTITTTMAALLLSLLALGALGLVACRGGDDDEATAGFETETPDSTEVRLSPEQKIEQTGNKWAPAFAAGSHFARMTQPALERITCKRIGGPKRTCTPPPSALRRSFQHATVQDTAIKGDKAAARFSNGETIELVHVSGRGWLIHRIGGNAGDEEFITKVGEEWAARFAKDDSAACHLMFAQPLCEEFFGSPGDAPSEPPTVGRPSGFQRSFANATLERVAITGIKAEAAFSNGELVGFIQETDEPRRALGSWFILDVGENAGAVLSGSGYRAQANEICRSGESEITQATRETFGFGTGSQGEVREFVTNTVVPNIQSQIDELRALTPPEDQAEEFEGWLDHAQAGLDELETDPVAGFTQPAANPFADVNREAAELGIDEC